MDFQTDSIMTVAVSITAILVMFALYFFSQTLKHKVVVKAKKGDLAKKSISEWIEELDKDKSLVEAKIQDGRSALAKLSHAHGIANATVNQIRVGLPPPSFKFSDDEELKEAVRACRVEQYEMIKSNRATTSLSRWSWFNSKADGDKLIKIYNKLMIGAFNSEFDIIRSKMRHSTGDAAIRKLESSIKALEKLAETVSVRIAPEYIRLKEREINVWYAYLVRKNKENEEAKEQRALLREQNRMLGRNSDDDEDELEEGIDTLIDACVNEIEKARAMAAQLAGDELAKLELKIEKIEEQKQELEAKFFRSQSQAQITRAGYIYVISNIGSFGAGVCKIGMTRRLEPMDRVVELGDASVPFRFDVHTLAFVDDAPKIEKSLHRLFHEQRVNAENHRKEFFKVTPTEVKVAMEGIGVKSSWYFDCDAKEYRESLLLRAALIGAIEARKSVLDELPEAI